MPRMRSIRFAGIHKTSIDIYVLSSPGEEMIRDDVMMFPPTIQETKLSIYIYISILLFYLRSWIDDATYSATMWYPIVMFVGL